MKTIDKINNQLRLKGVTGAELCRGIGLSNSIYSQWNTGKVKPSNKTVSKIATYLKVKVEDLIDDDKPLSKSQKQIKTFTNLSKTKIKKQHTIRISALNGEINGFRIVSEKDKRLIDWFRSLPEEKQKAILIAQDGPEDAV